MSDVIYTLELLEIDTIRVHEELVPETAIRLASKLEREGMVRQAVLVERAHRVLLDGHHRLEALRRLGCRLVPAYVVDYDDPEITLTTWPGAIPVTVTKEEVIEHALTGRKFPPKTTRHRLNEPPPPVAVPLSDLR